MVKREIPLGSLVTQVHAQSDPYQCYVETDVIYENQVICPWMESQLGIWKRQACKSEPGEIPAVSGLYPELTPYHFL